MLVRLALLALATALLSACSSSSTADEEASSGRPTLPSAETHATPITPPTTRSNSAPSSAPVRLKLSSGEVELTATLRDTEAARGLLEQLPLMLTMRDHGGVEKTGPLPRALSIADEPDGADPAVADLGYYAPSNDLVLYYGNQSYYDGIVILGRLQGSLDRLHEIDHDLTVNITRSSP